MSLTTPYHDDNNINNNGLLTLESLNNLNKINNISLSWTIPCHSDDIINRMVFRSKHSK